jgi:hypothetical protein
MLQARSRHYTDMMAKIKHYQEENTMKELQRLKNRLQSQKQKQQIQLNRTKKFQDNRSLKRSIKEEVDDLKAAAYIHDAGEFDHKKAVWRDVMSQKQGVKSMK